MYLPVILLNDDDAESNRTEVVYKAMKRRIVELALPPGSQFTEGQLATEWGVSKTPVREALARLRRDGLVAALPRAGYQVSPVTLNDAADLCALRRALACEAADLMAVRGASASVVERLQELVPHEWDSQDAEKTEAFLRAGAEFESLVANGSQNERVAAALVAAFDDLERVVRVALRIMPWSATPSEERQAIVDAIRAQDGPAARAAMLERTRSSEREILGALMQSASIGDVHIELPGVVGRPVGTTAGPALRRLTGVSGRPGQS